MATFWKRDDKRQVRVRSRGHSSLAESFNTKAEAIKLARHTEFQLYLVALAPKAAMPRLYRIVEVHLPEHTPTEKRCRTRAKPRPADRQDACVSDVSVCETNRGT